MRRRAFTLIELLTVMAITGVMLTLIVLPIFQSFNILRTAQAFADAQDTARRLADRIAREVGNAVSVRDAGSTVAVLPTGAKDASGNFLGGTFNAVLPYTKLDLVPPAQIGAKGRNGGYIDPITGKEDPTLTRPKGDINLSVLPGATLVRYWIGLNRPFDDAGNVASYNEPYTGILMPRNGSRDNLLVLRRIEVQPFVYRPRKDGTAGTLAWRPNLAYFRSDDKVSDTQDFDNRIIDLDDPYFFVADGKYLPEGRADLPGNRLADPEKNNRVRRWAGLAAGQTGIDAANVASRDSTIVTEVTRYDMIRPSLTGTPPRLVTTNGTEPVLIPLVQFRPTRVASEPAAGSAAARPGQAVDGLDRIGPDTYRTSRGLWTNAIVRFYPGGFAPGGGLEIANTDAYGGASINTGQSDGTGLDAIAPNPNNFVLFDLKTYEQYLSRGQDYPFTAAALSAGATDTAIPLGYPGIEWYNVPAQRQLFTPFRVVTSTGKLITSFSIDEVGTKATPNNLPNLPYVDIKANDPSAAATPAQDPGSSVLSPLAPTANEAGRNPGYNPNRAYNYVFNTYPELQGVAQRFIDLRMLANLDGTLPPLNPFPPSQTGAVTGMTLPATTANNQLSLNRVHLVPGSVEVYAPNQTPGPNYGQIIRYTEVSGEPGINQYRGVYADLPEPKNASGAVDYSVLGFSGAVTSSGGTVFSPASYDVNNVVSAQIQPRYKAGYLQFDSDPTVPLPVGRITVKYRFQLNGPRDTFAVDLDTREVMQILLTVKNYPQSNVPNAQTVTLKSTATLRNALR